MAATLALAVVPLAQEAGAGEPYWCLDQSTCCLDPCQPEPKPVPPRPEWYFRGEGLILRRDVHGVTEVASLGALGPFVLNSGQLDSPFKAGVRLLAGHTFGESPFQAEVSYFTLDTWDASLAIRDTTPNGQAGQTGNLFSPFTGFGNPPVLGVDYNNFVSIRETSSLDGGEFNLLRELPMPPGRLTAAFLVGARYMRIREEFDYVSQSALPLPLGATNTVNTQTRNELWGPQIGGLMRFYVEQCWWVDFSIKGAICNNAAHQQTVYTNVNNGVTLNYVFDRSANTTTYVGDLGLSLVYRWTPLLTTRVGYQAMWLQNLALASENFARPLSILTLGPGQLQSDGQTVYHGIQAGVELSW